jgi:hypothetical protein
MAAIGALFLRAEGTMPDLTFHVESAEAVPYSAAPLLSFKLGVANADTRQAIYSVALRCQIQIEVTRRQYTGQDQERMLDLFGEPDRWSQTLRNMLWTNASTVVAPFTGRSSAELQVPCSFDFNVASTKYFHGLEDGDIPLCLMFSGTVLYDGGDGAVQVAPISWAKEARFRLRVKLWREMMDIYYPNNAWMCLRRDVFDRLYQYKVKHGIPTWEEAIESLLPAFEETIKR